MNYRSLGNTGLKVSEISLGCEGFLYGDDVFAERMFDIAIKNGVNCMDLYTPNPDVHRRVKSAISGCRKDFVLQAHLCAIWENGQYRATRRLSEVKSAFETMLKNLGTDYIDIGMIHYVDSAALWNEIANDGILDYAKQLKREGRIRHIGISSHNPAAALAAVQEGSVEVLMFSVNPCYDLLPASENCETLWSADSYSGGLVNIDPQREELYATCQRAGVGITVMKAFGGGDLLSDTLSPAGKSLTSHQCLHYALTRPAVACIMAGVRNEDELRDCLSYENAGDEQRDFASAFASFKNISWQGHCMYCGHCAPCPKGIDVASVTKFLNLAKAQGAVPETVREHYAALAHTAKECIGCRACEKRCPFGVAITKNMRTAVETFGK